MRRAWRRNSSSPSFSEIELTTPLPWRQREPGLEHRPLRAVDHDRQARHLRLGRDHVQERRHRLLALEQVGVHVHVEHVGAAAHLLERDADRRAEVARLDHATEARRAGDVRPLADQDEAGVGADLERLQAAEPRLCRLGTNWGPRLEPAHGFGDRPRVLGRRAAAASRRRSAGRPGRTRAAAST